MSQFGPVNLQKVEQTLAKMRLQITALQKGIDAIAADVAEAKADRDEFSLHIFRSRLAYRRAVEAGGDKAPKSGERQVRNSFIEAVKHGYRGSMLDWEHLLRARPPVPLQP